MKQMQNRQEIKFTCFRRRITLVSLYLGNGTLEEKIVDSICGNPDFVSGNLKVDVLVDFTRGSRDVKNSRTLLRSLLEKNEGACDVSLYHTPVLRGITKRIVPDRYLFRFFSSRWRNILVCVSYVTTGFVRLG